MMKIERPFIYVILEREGAKRRLHELVKVEQDIPKKNKKNKYYSLNSILGKNAVYNVVFGERSNGKTYAVLKYAIDQYFNGNGGEFAIIRRWQEDIRGKRASAIFSALIENNEIYELSGGEYEGVTYFNGRFFFCNYEGNKPIYNEGDVFAYIFSLSDQEHNKSFSYPKVKTILFDEFLTRGMTLTDEFVLFMNTISTIIRQRTDVKIFMLGNTVNKYSPYFKEMGLKHVPKQEQGTIDVYDYGESKLRVAVEYASSSEAKKKNNFYFAFDNPKLSMITDGAWELDIYPHLPVKYKPQDILLTYFIKFDGNIYQAEIIDTDGEPFTYIHDKSTPIKNENEDLVFSLEFNHKMNYQRSIYKPVNQVGKAILYFFQMDKIFYQDNEVGDAINNYLNISKQL